jgi:hypothetical protein
MADQQELDMVTGEGRNRSPGALSRFESGASTFAPGTVLPRLQALIHPGLYRERGDTNDLVEKLTAPGGALANLEYDKPELWAQIKQQADTPMSVQQHNAFQSSLYGLVQGQIDNERKVQRTTQDNTAYMSSLAELRKFAPGVNDPKLKTYEEGELEQIDLGYKQAQEMALYDPEGSKALMADVKKRGDTLTQNLRGEMEKRRKAFFQEDSSLAVNSRNALSTVGDALEDLDKAIAKGGEIPEQVLNKALAAYGAAGNAAQTTAGDVITQTATGAATGAPAGLVGAGIGAAIAAGGGVIQFFKSKERVQALRENLQGVQSQINRSYADNRAALGKRAQAQGLLLGEQPGEVYSVAQSYQAQADKIPDKASTPAQDDAAKNTAYENMLKKEQAAAQDALAKAQAPASARMPGADAMLAAAKERASIANDDLSIFQADMQQQPGAAGQEAAGSEITQARQRRAARSQHQKQSEIRAAIGESLRNHIR